MKAKFLVIGVGFVIGALSVWFVAYDKQVIMGVSSYTLIGIGSFVASLCLSLFRNDHPKQLALRVYLGILLAAIARIAYDTTLVDPTSHNLFPFELIVYTIFSLPPALAGAYLVYLVRRKSRNDKRA